MSYRIVSYGGPSLFRCGGLHPWVTSNVNAVGLTAIHHRGSGTCTLQAELELAQRDGRDHAAEVYRQRSQIDDSNDVIESLKRENKNLAGIVIIIVIIVTDRRTDGRTDTGP